MAKIRRYQGFAALAVVLGVVMGCGSSSSGGSGPGEETRSFALGFTDYPHSLAPEAYGETVDVVRRDGDLAAMHFDDGVPWQEALSAAAYAPGYAAELNARAAAMPAGHVVYLAVTPIAFSRDGLAAHRGEAGNEPLAPPWDAYHFDTPEVIDAFTAHANNMIAIFNPDYFAYAVEANMLLDLAPGKWAAFVTLAQEVYARLKARHPNLPCFITFQADSFHGNRSAHSAGIAQLLPYTDFMAVSSYPFGLTADPKLLPADHFSALADLAPEKPFAVAETGWPAEDVTTPFPVTIPASEATQQAYVERLLVDADGLSAAFVMWFVSRDYDDLWESYLQFQPNAALLRLWKDNGLYTGDGQRRPALESWRGWLARRRSG
jgi:hypothetical protein